MAADATHRSPQIAAPDAQGDSHDARGLSSDMLAKANRSPRGVVFDSAPAAIPLTVPFEHWTIIAVTARLRGASFALTYMPLYPLRAERNAQTDQRR